MDFVTRIELGAYKQGKILPLGPLSSVAVATMGMVVLIQTTTTMTVRVRASLYSMVHLCMAMVQVKVMCIPNIEMPFSAPCDKMHKP